MSFEFGNIVGTAFSVVGAYYMGYPGMMIGMSLANILFPAKEAKEHLPINELNRGTNVLTKLNPVPIVLGTDLSPGQIINNNEIRLVTSEDPVWWTDTLYQFEAKYTSLPMSSFNLFGEPDDKAGKIDYLYADFHVCFAYADSYIPIINQVWYNQYTQWDCYNLPDRMKEMMGYKVGDPDAQYGYIRIDAHERDSYLNINWYNPDKIVDGINEFKYKILSYKGMFGEPTKTSLSMAFANPEIIEEDEATGNQYALIAEKWNQFPNIKAELTGKGAQYSRYAMKSHENPNFEYFNHSYRDNRADYLYGINSCDTSCEQTLGFSAKCSIQMKCIYTYAVTRLIDDTYSYNNITKGYNEDMCISRQDLSNPERLYFFLGRNWYDGGTYKHSHANYSIMYDIFYVDRTDNSVTSLIYDKELNIERWGSPSSRFKAMSFELTSSKILVFGYQTDTDCVNYCRRTIHENPDKIASRVYADFSAFGDDYWKSFDYNGFVWYPWARISGNDYEAEYNRGQFKEERRVINQTTEYIDVEGNFGTDYYDHPELYTIRISWKRDDQAEWGIVGEGSTRSLIIVEFPNQYYFGRDSDIDEYGRSILFNLPTSTSHDYDTCWLKEDVPYSGGTYRTIVPMDDRPELVTVVNLTSPMDRDPIPGEKIWFGFSSQRRAELASEDRVINPQYSFKENYEFRACGLSEDDTLFRGIVWDVGPSRSGDAGPCEYFNFKKVPFPETFSRHTAWNEDNGFSHGLCLSLDKSTGVYINTIINHASKVFRYTGVQHIFIIQQATLHTVSTDAEIYCAFTYIKPYNQQVNYSVIINKSDLTYRVAAGAGIRPDTYYSSHAVGVVYRGAVKARMYSEILNQTIECWVALAIDYSPLHIDWESGDPLVFMKTKAENYRVINYGGVKDNHDQFDYSVQGIYLVKLDADGHFLEHVIKNPDIDASPVYADCRVLQHRSQLVTGPGYTNFYHSYFNTYVESPDLRMCDYNDKLFYKVTRSAENTTAGYEVCNEFWCSYLPNEYNSMGYHWCLSTSIEEWGYQFNSQENLRSCKYLVGGDDNHYSNYCDITPVVAVEKVYETVSYYNKSEGSEYGLGQTFNPYFGDENSPINISKELIDTYVSYCDEIIPIKEPRFQYSNTFSEFTDIKDAIRDILATCQGFLVQGCDNNDPKALGVRIPNPNEEAVFYFGLDTDTFTVSASASSGQKLISCSGLTDYPTDYWKGDIARVFVNDVYYEMIIMSSSQTGFEVLDNLTVNYPIATEIIVKKDNVKNGSFIYWKKPNSEKANTVRVEFKNRLLEYKMDVVEAENRYKTDVIDKTKMIRQYELHGIKRITQAARMALRLLDYETYVNWMSSFVTDLIGLQVCMGDIIGVTHSLTNWDKKLFRIVGWEEVGTDETKLELEEYIPDVYHDYPTDYFQCMAGFTQQNVTDVYVEGADIYAFHDVNYNRVYIGIRPDLLTNSTIGFQGYILYVTFAGKYFMENLVPGESLYAVFAWADYDCYPWPDNYPWKVTDIAGVIYGFAEIGTWSESLGLAKEMICAKTVSCPPNDYAYPYDSYSKKQPLFEYDNLNDFIEIDPDTIQGGSFAAEGYIWWHRELIYYRDFDGTKFTGLSRDMNNKYRYSFVHYPSVGTPWQDPFDDYANISVVVQADYHLPSFTVPDFMMDRDIRIVAVPVVWGVPANVQEEFYHWDFHVYGDMQRSRRPVLIEVT